MISLWPHQRDGLLCTLAAFESARSAALVHATGTGKSITIASLATIFLNRGAQRVLTCTPRGELVKQLYGSCRKVSGLPDHRLGIEMAGERASTAARIVVASLDSCSVERMRALGDVDLVVIDEAHWAPKKFVEVLNAFPNAKVLGATATPDRLDGMPLSPYFEVLTHVYDVKDAIADGILVPLEFIEESIGFEVELGPYDNAGMLKRVVLRAAEQAILKHLMEPNREIQFIAFCNSVTDAYELADDLGPQVRCVEGDMTEREREKNILDLKERRIIGLTCRDLLTLGFDYPALGAVVLARSTQEGSPHSRSLCCFDMETEVLTPAGWRRGHEISVGDLVAGYEQDSGGVSWQPVLARVVRPLSPGEGMVCAQTPTMSMRLTDWHRVYLQRRFGRRRTWENRICFAEDLPSMKGSLRMPVAGNLRRPRIPLTDDEIFLLGLVDTDGFVSTQNKRMGISQTTKYPGHCPKIESVLNSCGLKWSVHETTSPTNFGPRKHPLRTYGVSFGGPRGTGLHLRGWSYLSRYVRKYSGVEALKELSHMSAGQWAVYLEAMHLGNGSKQEGYGWTRRGYHIAIPDESFADWIQAQCVTRGWRCNIRRSAKNVYQIHCRRQGWRSFKADSFIRTAPERGAMVWCVQVESGAVMVRRDGKAFASGNSQIVGRVTRKFPGKEKGIVLDLVGALRRHKLRVPDAVLRWERSEMEWPLYRQQDFSETLDQLHAHMEDSEAIDTAESSGVTLTDDSLRVFLTGSEILDPLIPLLGIEVPDRADGEANASEDQRKRLAEAGFDLDALLGQLQADVLLEAVEQREAQGLATLRQARVVARYGLDPNMTRADAEFCLDALQAAYWPKKRLPAAIAARPELFYTGGGVVTIRG